MSGWKVFALRAGRSRIDRSMATYLEGIGVPLVIPHTMFILRRGRDTIAVDTSFSSTEEVQAAYPQEIWRQDDEHPRALLGEIGLELADVELVICTHLHYDHCGCNELFARARVLVQRRELEYALAPKAKLMEREFFSPSGGFTPPFDAARCEPVDGDLDLHGGLKLLWLPGHTPGSQGVLVPTDSGPLCLAGDLVMVRENFEQVMPVGLHTDVDAWYSSHAKLRTYTDHVVPSHDMRVFDGDQRIAELA